MRDQPRNMVDLKKVQRKIEWRKSLGRVDRPIDPATYEIVFEKEPCTNKGYFYEHLSRRLSYSKCYEGEGKTSFVEYKDKPDSSALSKNSKSKQSKSRTISRLPSPTLSSLNSGKSTPKMKKSSWNRGYKPSTPLVIKKYQFLDFDILDEHSRKRQHLRNEELRDLEE